MMDKESGRHRGFGFVNYENSEAVEAVLKGGPHVMDGQTVRTFRCTYRLPDTDIVVS